MSEYIVEVKGQMPDAIFERELTEIVRCRDCKWFTSEYWYEEERGFGLTEIICEPPDCGNPIRCATTYDSLTKKYVPIHIITEPDGYCAWAERRDA